MISQAIRTVGGGMAGVVRLLRVGDVHELLVAHVAFTAAEENVGAHLPLHALVAAEDKEVGIRNTHTFTHSYLSLHAEALLLFRVHRT